MKTRYLLPHTFKIIGWVILIPAVIAGLLMVTEIFPFPEINMKVLNIWPGDSFFGDKPAGLITNDVKDELICVLIIIGALFAACSREKVEDEYIAIIRLECLLWATYINFGLLIVATLFIYGGNFMLIMDINLVSLLLIFLIRFNFIMMRNAKLSRHEK